MSFSNTDIDSIIIVEEKKKNRPTQKVVNIPRITYLNIYYLNLMHVRIS